MGAEAVAVVLVEARTELVNKVGAAEIPRLVWWAPDKSCAWVEPSVHNPTTTKNNRNRMGGCVSIF
jgi:hypothetical protein